MANFFGMPGPGISFLNCVLAILFNSKVQSLCDVKK